MNEFYKTKEQIEAWLTEYKIKNYTLIKNAHYGYVVNVKDFVTIATKNLIFIPVKFNYIESDLFCYGNKLTSLEFCPSRLGGNLLCGDNLLTSLQCCPHTIRGSLLCPNNKLTSLKFSPKEIGNTFDCSFNQLTSLKWRPSTVKRDFNCSDNQLINLDYLPKKVGSEFLCKNNPLLQEFQFIKNLDEIKKAVQTGTFKEKLEKWLLPNEEYNKKIKL